MSYTQILWTYSGIWFLIEAFQTLLNLEDIGGRSVFIAPTFFIVGLVMLSDLVLKSRYRQFRFVIVSAILVVLGGSYLPMEPRSPLPLLLFFASFISFLLCLLWLPDILKPYYYRCREDKKHQPET